MNPTFPGFYLINGGLNGQRFEMRFFGMTNGQSITMGSSTDLIFNATVALPEPSTTWLIGLGVLGFVIRKSQISSRL